MKNISPYIAAMLLLAACAIDTRLPDVDGRQSYLIECDGLSVPWSVCYSKASELCGGQYTLAEKNQGGSSFGGFESYSGNAGGFSGGSTSVGGSGIQKNITVVCGQPTKDAAANKPAGR